MANQLKQIFGGVKEINEAKFAVGVATS